MNIAVDQLGKRFNREWIFKNLSYSFVPNKTYAVVGPNGCGKSTLLQVLWGQVPQSVGSISYSSSERKIPVDEVFNFITIATPYMELVEEFTLNEMIQFHFKFKKAREQRGIEDILNLMELSHVKHKPLHQFSSGMRQRVKLGLAFFSESEAIFLDEPTTNLDKASTQWYQDNILKLPSEILLFIASNQEHEYPANAEKIEILQYK